jgi:pimeloyl-ACP methyl ester carboxylesterase
LHGDVVMVPDAGHYPHVEYPDIVNPRLVEFCHRANAAKFA